MTLKGKTIQERRILTKHYPVAIVGAPGAGKTSAFSMLSTEDKKRTLLLDIDNKGVEDTLVSDWLKVIKIKPPEVEDDDTSYNDYENVSFKLVEDIPTYLGVALKNESVDRVVIDSFSALSSSLYRTYVYLDKNFTIATNYNKKLHDFFHAIKHEVDLNGKFLYIIGHYMPEKITKTLKGVDITDREAEKFIKVLGREHYRTIEMHFKTVVIVDDFRFRADSRDTSNSSRIARVLSPYLSNENDINELEADLTKQ